jgi:hypothetical protein
VLIFFTFSLENRRDELFKVIKAFSLDCQDVGFNFLDDFFQGSYFLRSSD